MRIVCKSDASASVSEKNGNMTAIVVRGYVPTIATIDGTDVGTVNIPFRVQVTKKPGMPSFGTPYVVADGWTKFNGGKSHFGPFSDDDLPVTMKSTLSPFADDLFARTDDAQQYELTLTVENGEIKEEARRLVSGQVKEDTAARLSKLGDRLAKNAAENAARKATERDQGQQTDQRQKEINAAAKDRQQRRLGGKQG